MTKKFDDELKRHTLEFFQKVIESVVAIEEAPDAGEDEYGHNCLHFSNALGNMKAAENMLLLYGRELGLKSY